MAKARARSAARKVKDKWRAKNWYQVLAPPLFDNAPIAETLAEDPGQLIGRLSEISLQDLTGDFRKSHIKLFFTIDNVVEGNAHTKYKGHTLTSDYLRRMIRRRKSHIGGVYDIETKDGAKLRVKPFAIAEKRIQNSQKKIIRKVMKDTITEQAKNKTLNEFIRDMLDNRLGSQMYKNCRTYYPVKRIEVAKTTITQHPTIVMEDTPPQSEKVEETEEPSTKEEKETEKKAAPKKKEEKPSKVKKEDKKGEASEKASKDKQEKKEKKTATPKKKAPAKKAKAAKKTATKTTKVKTAKKTTAKKKTAKKKTKSG